MAQLAIAAEPREEFGKAAARRLRREGKVPGVVYGPNLPQNLHIKLEAGPIEKLLQSEGASGLIELRVNGASHTVLIKGAERDPIQGKLLHVDFHAVTMDEEVQVSVAIQLTGEERRPSDGGIVTQQLREIEVRCLPAAIPERLTLDISALKIGGSLTVKDIRFPGGVRPAAEGDEIVVMVLPPAKGQAEPEGGAAKGEGDASGRKENPAKGGGR